MRFAWISRESHAEMMGLMTAQIEELRAERKMLLDRLATLGLGGPLFQPAVAADSASGSEDGSDVDETAAEMEQLLRLRRRPSQLADALTRKAHRDRYKMPAGPRVSWVPASDAVQALDQVEAAAVKP